MFFTEEEKEPIKIIALCLFVVAIIMMIISLVAELRADIVASEDYIYYSSTYDNTEVILHASSILGMYLKRPVTVNVFNSLEDFNSFYWSRFNHEFYNQKKQDFVHAFYSRMDNAIYILKDDMNDNVMAHEIAHAIITQNFYLFPLKSQEILAMEVDKKFKEKKI